MNIYQELHKFNDIIYKDSDHSYLIDGIPQISGTKLVSKYKEPFDTEGMALKYSIKHNLDVNDVLADWDLKRTNSTTKGTAVHSYAEFSLANKKFEAELPDHLVEAYNKCCIIFDRFHEDWNYYVHPTQLNELLKVVTIKKVCDEYLGEGIPVGGSGWRYKCPFCKANNRDFKVSRKKKN